MPENRTFGERNDLNGTFEDGGDGVESVIGRSCLVLLLLLS